MGVCVARQMPLPSGDMKAERRHDLKTNTLATTIVELPNFWKLHGTKILFALVALVAIALLVQYRMQSRADASVRALQGLSAAHERINQLRSPMLLMRQPAAVIDEIRANSELADAALTDVLTLSPDSKIKAEALVARGDLNLLLAHIPSLPEATTRPALQKALSNEEYLKRAQDAYSQVLGNTQYLEHRASAITAHFGMAAIYEDRAEWKDAEVEYRKILDDKTAPRVLQLLAQRRVLDELPAMQASPLLGSTTAPAVSSSTTQATTAPAK